jgi:hypothetical protein
MAGKPDDPYDLARAVGTLSSDQEPHQGARRGGEGHRGAVGHVAPGPVGGGFSVDGVLAHPRLPGEAGMRHRQGAAGQGSRAGAPCARQSCGRQGRGPAFSEEGVQGAGGHFLCFEAAEGGPSTAERGKRRRKPMRSHPPPLFTRWASRAGLILATRRGMFRRTAPKSQSMGHH